MARTYGQTGAWPVARDVLKRFNAALPDGRQPERLKLMEAATYLGELDKAHGLALLSPQPPPSATSGPSLATVLASATGTTVAPPRPDLAAGDVKSELSAVHDIPADSLAMIRQAEMEQSRRIARLDNAVLTLEAGQQAKPLEVLGQAGGGASQRLEVVLPAGPVLSEAEMKRQDAAGDAAYAILIELVKGQASGGESVLQAGAQARGEILWLVGFFEGQLRANRAVALIERFLADEPSDGARVVLSYRRLTDLLAWAGQRQAADKIDQAWVDARHELFEQARKAGDEFIKQYAAPAQQDWVNHARLLKVDGYEQEAALVASVSAARAAGLYARASDELLALADAQPDHPQAGAFAQRLWNIANRLTALGQRDQAIYVYSRLPIRFPADPQASQAILQIAQLYAANLTAPLRAVETYQEYLALAGDNESIRMQMFSLAQQLASKQRYLEALHVYGVFVNCFPTDARAPEALLAIGGSTRPTRPGSRPRPCMSGSWMSTRAMPSLGRSSWRWPIARSN